MKFEDIKKLKDKLWETATDMRANSTLSAHDYAEPILGLIFLKFADAKYAKFEDEINNEYEKLKNSRRGSREISEIAVEKAGICVPDVARYEYLLNQPEKEGEIQRAIKQAMEAIEKYSPQIKDTLPKEKYDEIPASNLKTLLKNFQDIPTEGKTDIFGEIYEFFLGKFAMAEGQGGGVFYTPASVVRYMVEVIQPLEGKILDPACGSGGMFVQSAHYAELHGKNIENLRAYGVEKEPQTVKLAKLNLLLHGLRGDITQANSFYEDPYDSYGEFDYVFANPPFNVKGVEYERVKDQKRFNEYGVPRNSTSNKKDTEKVPNANYLWINQFITALNENGKAALVMPNGASTVGDGGQKEIRQRLIESGHVSQVVVLPSNMFNTVTLPATLWFFDKTKKHDDILFINANHKELFTQVNRAHRQFEESHIQNLAIISRLREGNNSAYTELEKEFKRRINEETKKEFYQAQLDWLHEQFPNGEYRNVDGLCSVTKINGEDSIESKDWSLSPGLYTGVAQAEEDDEPFEEKMTRLTSELSVLMTESNELDDKIREALGGIGFEI